MTKSVTVSAPGKVLLAGGYLVLESPNVGLVIAANKRFYCKIDRSEDSNDRKCHIVVNSPQFHSVWEYQVEASSEDDDSMSLTPSSSNKSENSFVEKTLRVTLAYVIAASNSTKLPSSLNITIQADNDFYSIVPHLQDARTPAAVESLPKFLPCPQDADGKAIVNKTGLGSSAALVTSVVGALLLSFELDLMTHTHNLAQLCHCHAQGKVGSGFDVSSAVFGSHVYRRFPKCTLADLLQDLSGAHKKDTTKISQGTMRLIQRAVETEWGGGVVEGMDLPDGLQLLLADVCGGSESPSMARKVLAWKASRDKKDTSSAYWEELEQINPKIIDLLKQAKTSDNDGNYQELHMAFQESRKALKSMGEAAGVPIEPEAQTALADATQALDGVIAAVVPGAGGYDALACLYVDKGDTKDRIGKLWADWNVDGTQVCPLAVEAGKSGDGLRVEAS